MVQLEKLLGKEDRFFELFETSAEQACHSVRALHEFLRNPDPSASLTELIAARRKDKAVTAQINELLCTGFVSAMEVEDIDALATSIYKIPKACEKIAERIQLAPQNLAGVDLTAQVVMMDRATTILCSMIKLLRTGQARERVTGLNEELQAVEGDADRTINELLRGLYNATDRPGRVLYLKDLYEMMEKVTDRCRDAGNVIVRIVLKGA
jgi:uncharacterized protein Yka (UPF0111/DUF47 family)